MPFLTDDEIRAMLDGATPGPWELDGIAIAHACSPYGYPIDVCLMGEPAHYPGDIPVMMRDWEDNARLIASAPSFAAEVLRLRGALRKCLTFIENTESEFGIELDSGIAARAALKGAAE